jgi:serpin B
MNQTGTFGYAETATAQILEMPYAGGALAFDVLLPKSPDGVAELEKSLTAENLAKWLGSLQHLTVDVALPKFRAESEFSLRDTLSGMGMPSAFKEGTADFSGIDDRRDLYLSQVVHKAFVDVTEEGTEAAAASGAVVGVVSYQPPQRFRADRPFAFVIRDTKSGVVLFAGRLVKPR